MIVIRPMRPSHTAQQYSRMRLSVREYGRGEQAISHKQSGPTSLVRYERPSGVRAQQVYDSRSTCENVRYGTRCESSSAQGTQRGLIRKQKWNLQCTSDCD